MNRLFNLAASLAVGAWDALVDAALRLGGRAPARRCSILYYHEVDAGDREQFGRQMAALRRAAKLFRIECPPGADEPGKHAAVTFDDAFVSVRDHALPALERHGVPAAIFIPTGSLGTAPRWIEKGRANSQTQRVMSEEELRALGGNGLLTMASHSVTHPRFTKLSEEAARKEFLESRETLERLFGREIRLFSFPHGALNEDLAVWAREAGYRRVYTISPQCAHLRPDEFATGRVHCTPKDSALEIWLKARGAYRWLCFASEAKRRLLGGRSKKGARINPSPACCGPMT